MSMNRDEQAGPSTEGTERMIRSEASALASLIGRANDSSRFSPQSSHNLQPSVELHIEELMLEGFAPSDRYLIGEAIQRELTRLLTEQEAAPALRHTSQVEYLNTSMSYRSADSTPEENGASIAQSVYGGLNR